MTTLICTPLNAQVVFVKEPRPAIYENEQQAIPLARMPRLQEDKLIDELYLSRQSRRPAKFGFLHQVNLSLENTGQWTTLANGDRVWQLKIYAPNAQTINLNYDKYDLPVGGKLYVYNVSKTDILGPFTLQNEKANQEFATGFTKGEYCIVEYHEPFKHSGKGVLQISGVVHGYRSIRSLVSNTLRDFQDAGACNYDVECSIGDGWEDQIKSVGLILAENNTSFCTGTLINTTAGNCQPYFLTADHCFPNDNPGELLNNIFLFNYQSASPACPGISISPGPVNQTVQGCTVIAKSAETDFCLMRLTNNPIDFYDVYYSGWDRRNTPAPGVVGIHHSSGDVKKISIEDDPIVSSSDNLFWLVPNWDYGTTEPGASGSSIFDINNKRILGQLCCGLAACNGSSNNGGEEDFGKIYYSWDQIGPNSSEQLKPWLDPINSGVLVMDGSSCPISPTAAIHPVSGYNFNLCGPGNLLFKDQSSGLPTSWSWTFSGAGVSPNASTLQNPEITINNAGTLTATLTVSNAQGTDVISQAYSVLFYNCENDTYCNTPNLSIPDNASNGVSNSIIIPSSSPLVDVDIELDINHSWVGDLVVRLEHGGTSIDLLTRPNAPIQECDEADIQATFDDGAALAAQLMCASSGSAINGNVIPHAPLSVFNNIDHGGTWTLSVVDQASDDIGVLNSWCIKTTSTTSALPIDLRSFNAQYLKKENTVELAWSTSSEVNNDYFVVEKSSDARHWKSIGKLNGRGNTSATSQYHLIDHNPLPGAVSYYRLLQVDFDGSFSYSNIESISIPAALHQDLSIYPNPIGAGDKINFTNTDKVNKVKLYTLAGQEIGLIGQRLPKSLPTGIYLLEIELLSGVVGFNKVVVK
ncbi:MAG: proprotein convertase P-domain-containing protein [Bacteroidota bacterium]